MKNKYIAAALCVLVASVFLSACEKVELKPQSSIEEAAAVTTVTTTTTAATTLPPEPQFVPDDSFMGCKSAILYDLTNDTILYSKNPNGKIFPASTTKVMTALVATEYVGADFLFYVGDEIDCLGYDSSRAWLYEGQQLYRNEILTAMLTPSGNDAAYTIAVNIARSRYGANLTVDECIERFAYLMNDYANYVGAQNTHFTAPDGYHDDEHYTTAKDMMRIAAAAARNETIREIVKQPLAIVEDYYGQTLSWQNGNLLLEYELPYTVTGMKTGFTDEAGFCFIGLAEYQGREVITLTFDCDLEYRFADTLKLMDYAFGFYDPDKQYTGYLDKEEEPSEEDEEE